MTKDEYFQQELDWIKYRLNMLDQIEAKLLEIRALLEYVQNQELDEAQKTKINVQVQQLQKEITIIDDASRQCRIEWR